MILATKTGWVICVELIRETPKAYVVNVTDEKRERRVPKESNAEKLFDCTDDAIAWISA